MVDGDQKPSLFPSSYLHLQTPALIFNFPQLLVEIDAYFRVELIAFVQLQSLDEFAVHINRKRSGGLPGACSKVKF